MDIESDDSERWEDFFGSSTELAPSLLGEFDTLRSNLESSLTSSNSNKSLENGSNNNKKNNNNNNKTFSNSINDLTDSSRHTSFNDEKLYNNSNINNSSNLSIDSKDYDINSTTTSNNSSFDFDDFESQKAFLQQILHIESDNGSNSSSRDSSLTLTRSNSSTLSCHNLSTLSPTSQINKSNLYNNNNNNNNNNTSNNNYSKSTSSFRRSRESLTSSNTSINKHRNNIRVLSANVQRIITHSDAEPVDTVDIDALQQQQQQLQQQQQQQQFYVSNNNTNKSSSPSLSPHCKQKPPTTLTNGNGAHKVKLSHIPLSKITGKLTQSGGNELVETFDSNPEYNDNFNSSIQTDKQNKIVKKQIINPFSSNFVDDEKTPTNNTAPFNFECVYNATRKVILPKVDTQYSLESISIKLNEMKQLANTIQELAAASNATTSALPKLSTISPTSTNSIKTTTDNLKEFIVNETLSPNDGVDSLNFDILTQSVQKTTLNERDPKIKTIISGEINEAINKPLITKSLISKPIISKPLVRSSSAANASTVSGSPLLTYARAKSLALAKANTLGGPVPLKLPTAQQLEELEEASKMSAESLDRLTDIKSKFSPKESRKISGLMLPDIAKLKHRPLSSSSICSTSSSSSSGSDQLNGKLTTSYLASVESLADPSESELMDPHSGMSVFERACLEIVDSERSFVEDLGQVIRGYLQDWKERACLRYDELKVLFSNIEEIYAFNSTLLKQLINSGMDPVKIAKCFIDLKERFDVYTTYCTSYPEAISLLTKLLQATHTNALLASTQKMLQHTLPLGSYLLKPVQRILKYHLLLDNLRKHCDVKEVFQAYELMRQVARNIDQVKRKLEQQSRVKELSGILDGWLGPELTVLGELCQEGLLMEHNKPRLVFLFATMLIITKPKEDNRLQFKSYIHQNNLMLSEHLPGEPTSFYVIPYDEPRNQIKLTAKNRDQKRLWAQHIKGVILEKFDNIPNRAKELVYKLGDEEDRTPDKNTWKWSLHSTSTPVYLERRNQYRRSEIRNRSKFKRKTVTNSNSFDSFNEVNESSKDATKSTKSLSRNNSIDDNMLPALQKLAAAVKNKNKSDKTNDNESPPEVVGAQDNSTECKCDANSSNENCQCLLRDQRKTICATNNTKSFLFSGQLLKERSKSVPRINTQDLDNSITDRGSLHGSNPNLDAQKSKANIKPLEVKQYNHKTIPKRIATLKKQRSIKKETSKFYMDLNEFDDTTTETVLKITESTENLMDKSSAENEQTTSDCQNTKLPDVVKTEQSTTINNESSKLLSPAEKAKIDAQIILDLLKNNKEFERLSKKPQKKRVHDINSSLPTSPEPQHISLIDSLPPRPPSRSPPPLESECENATVAETSQKITDTENDEPIYESLLRNVHVPYKFSPVFARSKSAHNYKPRDKKPTSPQRPDSDYVTLVYSPEGHLQKIGDEYVKREPHNTCYNGNNSESEQHSQRSSSGSSTSSSSATLKRESQNTVINVNCSSFSNISQISSSPTEVIYATPMPKNFIKRLLQSNVNKSSLENVSTSETSLLPRSMLKSIDNISLAFGRSNKPPERRVSDVTEMCRQSILHRQGSEAVGERIAHVDYADPRTLFSVATSEASLQRDSVFSLTSSSDSVCEQKRTAAKHSTEMLTTNFEYEQDVEACLEHDFRDSAIYSDDNEKRTDSENGNGHVIKRPSSPPPLPPTIRARHHPQVPPKPTSIPPPTTVTPTPTTTTTTTTTTKLLKTADKRLLAKLPLRNSEQMAQQNTTNVIVCPSHLSPKSGRSWVLQQIENFNK